MSVRTIASGSDFMVFLRSGNEGAYTYRPFAGQTNCTLAAMNPTYRESVAKNLGGWKDFFQGIKEWNASVDLDVVDRDDVDANEVGIEELEDAMMAGTKLNLVFAHILPLDDPSDAVEVDTTKRMYSGKGLVNVPLNAPSGENQTSTCAIQGCLKLTPIDPT